MRPFRPVMLAVAAAVAACSTGSSPLAPNGPPGINFLAAPSVVAFGNPVQLSLTNSSSDVIIARPCPLSLERWNGFTWDIVPDGSGSCSRVEDTLATGAAHDYDREVDVAQGLYRAVIEIHNLGTTSMAGVYSNTFSVTQ